jgi:hypothetical protein
MKNWTKKRREMLNRAAGFIGGMGKDTETGAV